MSLTVRLFPPSGNEVDPPKEVNGGRHFRCVLMETNRPIRLISQRVQTSAPRRRASVVDRSAGMGLSTPTAPFMLRNRRAVVQIPQSQAVDTHSSTEQVYGKQCGTCVSSHAMSMQVSPPQVSLPTDPTVARSDLTALNIVSSDGSLLFYRVGMGFERLDFEIREI